MAIQGLPTEGRELAGQVALVTGAAKNIRRAISIALAAAGAAVAVNTLRSREEAEAVVQEIRATGIFPPANDMDVMGRAYLPGAMVDLTCERGCPRRIRKV